VYTVFESNWLDTSMEVKKNMIFFVMRCQKPVKMSALDLFYLSLDTFMRVRFSLLSNNNNKYRMNSKYTRKF
jgi:hypothetical protein